MPTDSLDWPVELTGLAAGEISAPVTFRADWPERLTAPLDDESTASEPSTVKADWPLKLSVPGPLPRSEAGAGDTTKPAVAPT